MENSVVILAQQVLSLADRGYFCIYLQRLLKILKRAKAMSIKHHVMAINYKVRYFYDSLTELSILNSCSFSHS